MTEFWTAVARCGVCKKELNRAEHVPASRKTIVMLGAPLMAVCPVREHNTLSDLNLKVEIEWTKEKPSHD